MWNTGFPPPPVGNRDAPAFVEYLGVASPGGLRARTRARLFVLPCRGKEIPRLLLTLRGSERNGPRDIETALSVA